MPTLYIVQESLEMNVLYLLNSFFKLLPNNLKLTLWFFSKYGNDIKSTS